MAFRVACQWQTLVLVNGELKTQRRLPVVVMLGVVRTHGPEHMKPYFVVMA